MACSLFCQFLAELGQFGFLFLIREGFELELMAGTNRASGRVDSEYG